MAPLAPPGYVYAWRCITPMAFRRGKREQKCFFYLYEHNHW